jgi:Protein of unknown function (DUF4232)
MRRVLLAGVVAGIASTLATSAAAARIPPRCSPARLRLAATFYGEAGGQFVQTLTFTNVGTHTCRLAGWPRLEGPAARRVVQGNPAARPFRSVLVRPRGAASFDVFGADWDVLRNQACPTLARLTVALPSGARTWRVAVRLPRCPAGFLVAPLVAGRTDRASWSVVWHG